jgi:hypothetical protein
MLEQGVFITKQEQDSSRWQNKEEPSSFLSKKNRKEICNEWGSFSSFGCLCAPTSLANLHRAFCFDTHKKFFLVLKIFLGGLSILLKPKKTHKIEAG